MKKLLTTLTFVLMALSSSAQTYHLDVNGNGSIDLTDALTVIDYILGRFNPDDQPKVYLTCPDENHPHMIDLGLPSGTIWACCNVGATTPTGYGGYYAWGETKEKTPYNWNTYSHCDGSSDTCYDLGESICGTNYDVAHVQWGGAWQMPTSEQCEELCRYANCIYEWTGDGGRFTSQITGGSIFFPAAGYQYRTGLKEKGSDAYYWTGTWEPQYIGYARNFGFGNVTALSGFYDHARCFGLNVRPVANVANAPKYHLDVNGNGSIDLTDALIIVDYILGRFNPDGDMYMVAQTKNSDKQLIPAKEVGSLVAADDALDFSVVDTKGNTLLENVQRADFKSHKDLDSTEMALLANRSASIPSKVKGIKKVVEGQCTFVVADKNGNNDLVKELTFKNENNVSSWSGDGKSGDVRNLQYIARAKEDMANASSDDIIKMLEELSGTDQADAQAMAAVASMNANVEEAFSEDGINVCLKTDSEDGYVMYPLYEMTAPFGDGSIEFSPTEVMPKALSPLKRASSASLGNVAIFNYFDGHDEQESYLQQNILVGYLRSKFKAHGYKVHYFGVKDNGEEKIFTQKNFEDVISQSSQYKAIIIMSHGGIGDNEKSYIATHDEPLKGKSAYNFEDPYEKKRYRMIPVEETLRDVSDKSIVYIGACCGVPKGGFSKDPYLFPNNTKSCAIAWEGRNSIAQAHAELLFHYLLYDGWSVTEALRALPEKDPKYYESKRCFSQYIGNRYLNGNEELRPQFTSKYKANVELDQKYVYKVNGYHGGHPQLTIKYRIYSDDSNNYPMACRIYFKNINTGYVHLKQAQIIESSKEYVLNYDMSYVIDGCHDIIVEDYRTGRRISLISPAPVLVSENFHEMYALPTMADDQLPPKILGSDEQPVEEITIPTGTSLTYQLDACPGHTFETPCLDKKVAEVSLSGTTLKVSGVSEGSTYFGVFDRQNQQMAVAQVTVTEGGTSPVSYLSCPDDNHPHMIDLGLPSGTKWACCNIGATTPEGYGGYYAWGETEEKEVYSEETYRYSQNYVYDNIGSDIAGTSYDVAHVKWGGSWQMSSYDQQTELRENCSSNWTTVNGINGRLFTGPSGASIFLPAGGGHCDDSFEDVGNYGFFWSSTLEPDPDYSHCACCFFIDSEMVSYGSPFRCYGLNVRPIWSGK